jgi:hypothetical protein
MTATTRGKAIAKQEARETTTIAAAITSLLATNGDVRSGPMIGVSQHLTERARAIAAPAAPAAVAATTIRNDLRCEPTEDARTR